MIVTLVARLPNMNNGKESMTEPILTLDNWKDTLGTVKVFTDDERGPYITVDGKNGRGWMSAIIYDGKLEFRSVKAAEFLEIDF